MPLDPVPQIVEIDALLDDLTSSPTLDVYEAMLPYDGDMVAAAAAHRALAGGGDGAVSSVFSSTGDVAPHWQVADRSWTLVFPATVATVGMPVDEDNGGAINFSALAAGAGGNSITVEKIDPGPGGGLGVVMDGLAVKITLATDGDGNFLSTGTEILAALADSDAAAFVSFEGTGNFAEIATPAGPRSLTGGSESANVLTLDDNGMTLVIGSLVISTPNGIGFQMGAVAELGGYWGTKLDGQEFLLARPAIDDDDVANGEHVQWFDDTVDAAGIRFKHRDSDGTLVTGKSAAMEDDGSAFKGVNKPTITDANAIQLLAALVTLGLVIDDT